MNDQEKDRRTRKAAYERERRRNETAENRKKRRDIDNARRRLKRLNATPQQIMLIRQADAQSIRERRARWTENQRAQHIANVSRTNRLRQSSNINIATNALKELADNALEKEHEIIEHYCGSMTVKCLDCGAKHFESEPFQYKTVADDNGESVKMKTFSNCCRKGQINLEKSASYPEPFLTLMKKTNDHGKNFMENIRSINSSFAFASMGAQIDAPSGYGPYCFRIHGQIYHRTGTLHPEEGDTRQYAQLYILDAEEANFERAKHSANANVNSAVFKLISDFMLSHNPFSKAYRMLHEVEKECIEDAEKHGMNVSEISMAIIQDKTKDQRRYNAARANEVAVIFSNKDGLPPLHRDLLIHLRRSHSDNNGMQRISILHSNLEALVYPIFFPYGEQGWTVDLLRNRTGSRVRVSQMEYYAYKLSDRDEFNPLLNGGKLTQQYIVDAYVKTEGNRLSYIQNNQKEWRGDTLKGLQDYIANEADIQGKRAGIAVILPSSFQGGPRYMHQNYQDAMAIVTKFGKPDLFITMTCNPKWKEISENLKPWQQAEHRPDLVAKVFNLKLKQLLNEITNKNGGIFGKIIAHVHVIEFQKRGLPHAHILLILDGDSKLNSEEKIDKVVKAEIPDRVLNPKLYDIVTSHMVHGPCGKGSRSPCMKADACTKKFPKSFQENTMGNGNVSDGYAIYKRRSGIQVEVKGKLIHNGWIVPYNPYLLLKYNCHINVEVCASVQSVKYLFKYVYKGHDCASVGIKDSNVINQDEIQTYLDSRYVSAPEGAWRLFGNEMHAQSHSVERLAIHLPGEQYVVFNPSEDVQHSHSNANEGEGLLERRINNAKATNTTLTGYFELNRTDVNAHEYFYWEIPLHYTWLKDKKQWKVRERYFNKIGRMYTVSPKDAERFYLRLLLLHVKAATSFEYLKTVDSILYTTFRDAARARGLLIDDDVWQKTLDDAIACQMPAQLRQVFAFICAYGTPSDPKKLWYDNLKSFTEDICVRRHNIDEECQDCEFYALKDLKITLTLLGKNLADICLVEPPRDLIDINDAVIDVEEERVEANRLIQSLNENQRTAFEAIVEAIDSNESNYFFIDGPGGSGKTYLYRTLIHYVRGRKHIVLPSASTGIAANLLSGGRTYHSLFRLGIPITETTVSSIKPRSVEGDCIRAAVLIILDECTMAPCHAIDAIDRFLRDLMEVNVPFGGKVILLGGDFRQCLAIIPHAMRPAIVQGSLKRCLLWNGFRKYTLVNNMRSEDPAYSEWLLELGNGKLSNQDNLGDDVIEIPERMVCVGSIVHEIFGASVSIDNVKAMSKRAILCPRNESVDKINDDILSLIADQERTFLSSDSIVNEKDCSFFPVEFLNSVNASGMPPHKLKLKIGCVIMLLRNLNTKQGLCNGTRLYVTGLKNNLIEAEILTGSSEGNKVLIPRIDITPTDMPFQMKRRQFPIKLAFAMTINKSQGQTLDKVGIFLPEPVFGHGQLYVAFSRVKRADDVKIKVSDTPEQGRLIEDSDKVFTRNVVYQEVFRD